MFGPSNDGSLYILDDQSNTFSLQPNFLTPYPGGLLGLAGNDNITGSVSPEIINGNQGDDLILGQGGADTSMADRITIPSMGEMMMISCLEIKTMIVLMGV
jgi:Ca2+-binding RTX toxin-like protein